MNEVKDDFDSIDSILKEITKNEDAYASGYWVPSLKREVRFRDINTSQQKRLAKSIIDSPVFKTEFIFTMRDILKENCAESIDIDELTLIDKLTLILGLRIVNIGGELDTDLQLKDKSPMKVKIDLMKLYNEVKSTLSDINPEEFEDEYFKIECDMLTVGDEYRLEKEMREHVDVIKQDVKTSHDMRELIGDIYINEIVKYISKVSIKQEDQFVPITKWKEFSFKDRIKLIERFKTKLLKSIIGYISKVKEEINKITIVNIDIDGETYEKKLGVDGGFFTIS
jgi:hypothetical protein